MGRRIRKNSFEARMIGAQLRAAFACGEDNGQVTYDERGYCVLASGFLQSVADNVTNGTPVPKPEPIDSDEPVRPEHPRKRVLIDDNPFPLPGLAYRSMVGTVRDDLTVVVGHSDILRFADRSDAFPPGTNVSISLSGREVVCCSVEELEAHREQERVYWEASRKVREEKERTAREKREAEDRAFNDSIKMPVDWVPGYKIVLSGLSYRSNGCGTNRATVDHIVVKADLIDGRFKRYAGEILCTGGEGDRGVHESPTARVNCKACLEIATRKEWKA